MKKTISFLEFNTQKIIVSELCIIDGASNIIKVPVSIEIDTEKGNFDFFLHDNPELKITFSIEDIEEDEEDDDGEVYYSMNLHAESTSLILHSAELQCILSPITRYFE